MSATPQTLPLHELLPFMTRDVIDTIANRHGGTEAEREARAASVRQLIEGFQAQDPVMIMLATQAVMMHALMQGSARDAERAATPDEAVKHRRQFATMLRLQLSQLRMIEKRRPAKPTQEEKPEQPAGTAPTATTPRPRPQPQAPGPISVAVPPPLPSPAREAPRPIQAARPGTLSSSPPSPGQITNDVLARAAAG